VAGAAGEAVREPAVHTFSADCRARRRARAGARAAGARRRPTPNRYQSANAQRAFETKAPDEIPFQIGQNVVHAKFGEGVVIDFKGRGLDASVQVRFATQGTKWLALQYAKLTAG
jgi:hypothetical protein